MMESFTETLILKGGPQESTVWKQPRGTVELLNFYGKSTRGDHSDSVQSQLKVFSPTS